MSELTECTFFNSRVERLNVFKENSDIIVANRVTSDLRMFMKSFYVIYSEPTSFGVAAKKLL